MARWLLTGDWQATRSNLPECEKAFGELIYAAKQYKVKGIINLGDLKDAYDPIATEVANFWVYVSKRIQEEKLFQLDLLGNHDRVGQYSDHRNWFPIFRGAGVLAIDEPKIVEKDTVVFACLPYIHDKKKLKRSARKLWDKVKKIKHKKRILLFHCDVRGADNGLGWISKTSITTSDLMMSKYDFCFGGHIHKRQELLANAIYVGNPFCCDWGEVNQEKGYVLYDDDKNDWKVIPSNIPGWYTYDYLKEKKKKSVLPQSKIKSVLDCTLSESYHKILDKHRAHILKEYPEAKVYVLPRFVNENREEDVVVDSKMSDEDKIKSYIKATIPSELADDKKKIAKYLISVLNGVVGSSSRYSGEVIIDAVKARNVLSYRSVDFSYRRRGVCLVRGVNNDWPGHSNGAGKSNFLNLLPIAWFGRTFKKEQKNDEWASELNKDKAYVRLTSVNDRGQKITTYRQRRKSKLKLKINDKDKSFGLRNVGQKETQGYIQQLVGFSPESLQNSIYIDSTMSKSFLEGTSKDRAELISRFQNIERFKLARDVVAKQQRKIQETKQQLGLDKWEAKDKLKDWNETLAKLQESISKQWNAKRDKKKLVEVVKEYKDRRKKISNIEHKLRKEIEIIEREKDEVGGALDLKEQDERVYEDRINRLDKEIRKIESVEGECPTCKQVLREEDKNYVLKSINRQKHKLKIKSLKLSNKRKKLQMRFDVLYSEVESKKDELVRLSSKLDDAKIRVDRYKYNYENSKAMTKDYSIHISSAKEKICKEEKKLESIRRSLLDSDKELELLSYCEKAFSRDGIPQFLNSLACPLLNQASQFYSKLFIDNEIQVRFELKDGDIVPVIVNIHGSSKISGQSDGEKAWAGIISSLALRELAPKTNILILDEPGYGLDPAGAKLLGQNIKRLGEQFETVLVTTHNREIEAALYGDNTITVVKHNKVSKLR